MAVRHGKLADAPIENPRPNKDKPDPKGAPPPPPPD
jgi:hypothetical protein